MSGSRIVLLTGATGYIGGRLLPVLERRGSVVRCLTRRPEALRARVAPGTDVAGGDLLEPGSLARPMAGVHTAYFLVHSMGAEGRFEELDRQAAVNFAHAAREAGVRRIIYLGGLGESGSSLSAHLGSRHEVGEILRREAGATQIVELRASIVIGAGSASFEMIRNLVERLPVMVTPRWVSVQTQPIGIGDVVAYLAAALDLPGEGHRLYEIGGRDVVSYGGLMREYARQRGLRRIMIPVPLLTPRLSSLWLSLVTPVHARVGRLLIEGLRHPTVVRDPAALEAFPIRPGGVAEAIAEALASEDAAGARGGGRLVDARSIPVPAPPERAFAAVTRLGGRNGWYYGNWLWRVRGWMDRLAGGPGRRPGRVDHEHLAPGDPVDFWRVHSCEPPRRLLLSAEMKLPGRAWLEFEIVPDGGGSRIRQTAVFDPRGVLGRAYWYALWPVHRLVFAGMLRGMARWISRNRPLVPGRPSVGPENRDFGAARG